MHFLIKMLIILKPKIILIFLVIVINTIQGRIDAKCLTVHLEVRDIPDDPTLVKDHATTKGKTNIYKQIFKNGKSQKIKSRGGVFHMTDIQMHYSVLH